MSLLPKSSSNLSNYVSDDCIIPVERESSYDAVSERLERQFGIRLQKRTNRKIREVGNFSAIISGPPDKVKLARIRLLTYVYPLHEYSYAYSSALEGLVAIRDFIDQLETKFNCGILKVPGQPLLKLCGDESSIVLVISELDVLFNSFCDKNDSRQPRAQVDAVREGNRLEHGSNSDPYCRASNSCASSGFDWTGGQLGGESVNEAAASSPIDAQLAELRELRDINIDSALQRLCILCRENYDVFSSCSTLAKKLAFDWMINNSFTADKKLTHLQPSESQLETPSKSKNVPIDSRSANHVPRCDDTSNNNQRHAVLGAAMNFDCNLNNEEQHDVLSKNLPASVNDLFADFARHLDEELSNPDLSNRELIQRSLQRDRLLNGTLQQSSSASALRTDGKSTASGTLNVPETLPSDDLRPVIIDGNNVAREHGRLSKVFSSRGIQLVIDFFKQRGHQDIVVYVPQWRPFGDRAVPPTTEGHLLLQLHNEGLLQFTPSRKNPITGRIEASYDDWYIVHAAHLKKGVIISNDQFRDVIMMHPEFANTVAEFLLPFNFLGDNFILPPDPRGRFGPSLDDILRKSPGTYSESLARVSSVSQLAIGPNRLKYLTTEPARSPSQLQFLSNSNDDSKLLNAAGEGALFKRSSSSVSAIWHEAGYVPRELSNGDPSAASNSMATGGTRMPRQRRKRSRRNRNAKSAAAAQSMHHLTTTSAQVHQNQLDMSYDASCGLDCDEENGNEQSSDFDCDFDCDFD